jgi:hypothetical protein
MRIGNRLKQAQIGQFVTQCNPIMPRVSDMEAGTGGPLPSAAASQRRRGLRQSQCN